MSMTSKGKIKTIRKWNHNVWHSWDNLEKYLPYMAVETPPRIWHQGTISRQTPRPHHLPLLLFHFTCIVFNKVQEEESQSACSNISLSPPYEKIDFSFDYPRILQLLSYQTNPWHFSFTWRQCKVMFLSLCNMVAKSPSLMQKTLKPICLLNVFWVFYTFLLKFDIFSDPHTYII